MNPSAIGNPMSQRTRHGPIKVRPTMFEGETEFIDDIEELKSYLKPWPTDHSEVPLDPKAEGWRELGEPPEDPDNLKGLPEAECDARAQPLRLSRKPKRRLPWPMPFKPDGPVLSVEPWMAEPFPNEIPWDKQNPKDMICKNTDKLTLVRWEEYPPYDLSAAETHDKAISALDLDKLPLNKPRIMTRRFPKIRLTKKENTTSDLLELYQNTKKHNSYQKFMLDEFHQNSFRSPKFFLKRNYWENMKLPGEEEDKEDGEGGDIEKSKESEWSRGRGGSTIGIRGAFRGRGGGGGGWRDGGVGRGTGRQFRFDEGVQEEEMNDEEKELKETLGREEYALKKKTDALLNKIAGDCDSLFESTFNPAEKGSPRNEQYPNKN